MLVVVEGWGGGGVWIGQFPCMPSEKTSNSSYVIVVSMTSEISCVNDIWDQDDI